MQLARVVGTLVATIKHTSLAGQRLLLVQPHDLEAKPHGNVTMAVDTVDAGVGDWVLVLDEGSSASQVLGTRRGPVRTLIVGVVDALHFAGAEHPHRSGNPRRDKGLTARGGSGNDPLVPRSEA